MQLFLCIVMPSSYRAILIEFSLYFIQILLLSIMLLELIVFTLMNKSTSAWFLTIFSITFFLLAKNWEFIPVFFLSEN